MNIIKFKNDFTDLLDEVNYKLYFGTKQMYNAECRDSRDNEVILEPFQFHLFTDAKCFVDTNFTLWILKHKEVDEKFSDREGTNTKFTQEVIDDTKSILNKINNSGYMYISRKIDEIPLDFYNANSSQSVNTALIIRVNIPVRIYRNE